MGIISLVTCQILGPITWLLGNSDLNISQISLECGFENPAHFSRVFKEDMNITPSAYRKQLKTA